MKFVFPMIVFSVALGAGGKIGTSDNCIICHTQFAKKWHTSRHAMSHFSKNDLFKKSLMFITREHPEKLLSEMKLKCAKCHNPRVTLSSIDNDDKISLLLGDSNTEQEIHKVLNSKNMKDGINCLVCHNVDRIHLNKAEGSQGVNSITFGPKGTIFGPFKDAPSPYHTSVQRDHFVGDDPTLCFACHYGMKNEHGLTVYATGSEYDTNQKRHGANAVTGCKSCHMSPLEKGVASSYTEGNSVPKSRMIRKHRFASVDNSDIVKKHVSITDRTENDQYIIRIENNAPHKLPTGYGLRELILQVDFYDIGGKKLKNISRVIGVKWKDAKGEMTIPHLAASMLDDTRIEPQSHRDFPFPIPPGSTQVHYRFFYRLIGHVMARKLNITDPFFLKNYVIVDKKVTFTPVSILQNNNLRYKEGRKEKTPMEPR